MQIEVVSEWLTNKPKRTVVKANITYNEYKLQATVLSSYFDNVYCLKAKNSHLLSK